MEGKGRQAYRGMRREGRRGATFLGGSDARIIVSADEAALIRLWHEQNVQMKSEDLGCLRETRDTPVLTPPNRQRRRLSSCGPFGASTRELATDNGRPPQI